MASKQKYIMDAVKLAVETALTGRDYDDDNSRIRRKPSLDKFNPGKKLLFVQVPGRWTNDEATNEEDEYGYGVLVTMSRASRGDPEYNTDFDELMEDREAVTLALHNNREVLNIANATLAGRLAGLKVEPGPMLIDDAHEGGTDTTALVVRVMIRERHG